MGLFPSPPRHRCSIRLSFAAFFSGPRAALLGLALTICNLGCGTTKTAHRQQQSKALATVNKAERTRSGDVGPQAELTQVAFRDPPESAKVPKDTLPTPKDEPESVQPKSKPNLEPNVEPKLDPIDGSKMRPLDTLPMEEIDIGETRDLGVTDVAASIHATFPLLVAAYQENQIAQGNQIAAWGAFDTKLKASSENGALGFYETFRHQAGFARPMYQGGSVFGGYRTGRGTFEPWYRERQTNDGGEFKAGVRVPLLRNREIDARRAALWRATYDRQRVQPEIRAQLIMFVRDGSVAFWKWVADGQKLQIGRQALELAQTRNAQLKRREEEGDIPPPVLQDNLRAIAKRQAKLIDLERKLQQSGIKLSLFYRTDDGRPIIADVTQLAKFPTPQPLDALNLDREISSAFSSRPELAALDALARRVNVDLAEARNNMLPTVDAQLVGAQDVGEPTSSKRDKSEFEVEAGVFVDVPWQRRKAIGKARAASGKLVQIAAKRRFTVDKIRAEVQSAFAALAAAFKRLDRAQESRRLAEYMAEVERRKFDVGESDLLSVALREQYAIEAAEAEIDALLEYFTARADLDAALARDWPQP